jgi:hypothetical protein
MASILTVVSSVKHVIICTGLVVFHSASSLNQLSVDIHVATLEHIIMILGQPVCALFLLGDACLAEKQQIPVL